MKRHHTLLAAGILLFVAAWFAWNVLLVESDTEIPVQAESQ
jgi:hypothetical protein